MAQTWGVASNRLVVFSMAIWPVQGRRDTKIKCPTFWHLSPSQREEKYAFSAIAAVFVGMAKRQDLTRPGAAAVGILNLRVTMRMRPVFVSSRFEVFS